MARQDAELLAVFGHGAAGDGNAAVLENLEDRLVAERVALLLLLDDLGNGLAHALVADVRATLGLVAGREEIFHLEDALWREDVFAVRRPAHGRLMHSDGLRDLVHSHRPQ